ncbi:MAG TPA: hypothetical protein PL037_00085 [Elusimicrobiales bacterium]|nr:hypothetical protein [Elusimicrobiales bacterium]
MTYRKRTLITAAAWAFALIGGYHSARAIYDNLTLSSMFSSPGFLMGMAGALIPVELPPLARLAAAHIRLVFAGYLLLSLSVLSAGVGLLLGKDWATALSRRLLYSAAGCCAALFLFPGLLVPEPFFIDGVAISADFNAAVGVMSFYLRVAALTLGAIFFFAARLIFGPGGGREEGRPVNGGEAPER